MRGASAEIVVFALCYVALTVAVPLAAGGLAGPWWATLLLQAVLLGLALDLSEFFTAALVRPCDLPKLASPPCAPRVALLYLVCDDLVPAALSRLGTQTYPVEIFVLDDSRDDATRRRLDACGHRLVRRHDRRGNKAGSINAWLREHGDAYDYFVLADSDSILPSTFVADLLCYAEHAANERVAIFNTLSLCWNVDSKFSRLHAVAHPIRNWVRMRLANRFSAIFSTGHNNLHRTASIHTVGGFDEAFVAEDIALTLRLVRNGFTSRLVHVTAFEAEPEDVFAYVHRLMRWARQTIEIHRADWHAIPFLLKWQMFRQTWAYLSFFVYPLAAVAAAWLAQPWPSEVPMRVPIRAVATMLMLPLLPAIIRLPLLPRAGIRLRDYAASCALSVALACYAMLAVCRTQIDAATSSALSFAVTRKQRAAVTLGGVYRARGELLVFLAFLAAGFWIRQPHIAGAAIWLPLLAAAPLLVYWSHGHAVER